MNDKIKSPEVLLISEKGEQKGVVKIEEALELANEANLDLVEISPNSNPPVCKILDFGKYRYEQSKKAQGAKKHQNQ